MKTSFVFLIFCLPALADFNKATLDQYIFHIQKYAESNCENVKEINLAGDANHLLNGEADSTKETDLLRDALSGIRDGMLASMMGQKNECKDKIIQGIVKLRSSIPTGSQTLNKNSSAP